jgi:hypothetical protein
MPMEPDHTAEPNEGLRQVAADSLLFAVDSLLDEESNADLRDDLPADFAPALADLAWRHQFDLDKARFRREAKRYLTEVASAGPEVG